MSLKELRKLVREALINGHETLAEALSKNYKEAEGVGGFGDISYGFDKLSEKAIIESIKSEVSRVYIISEEAGFIACKDPEYYVIIDPVDGSTNAFYGIPFHASSILISKSPKMEDAVVAGVIDHSSKSIFVGDREGNVSINDHAPKLRRSRALSDALIQMNLDALRKGEGEPIRKWAEKILRKARHIRYFSAASLELCYLLDGKADAYICLTPNLKIMDFCASVSLLRWSGGAYRILGKEPTLLDTGKFGVIAASSRELLEEICSLRRKPRD